MSTRGRAWRRAQRARMIQHAKKAQIVIWREDPEEIHETAVRIHNHLQVCSCYGCGNPRHSGWLSNKEMLTLPERKAYSAFLDGLEEAEDILDK